MKFVSIVLMFLYITRDDLVVGINYLYAQGCKGVQPKGLVYAMIIEGSGQFINGYNEVGTLIKFNCFPGYVLSGSSVIECLNDGTYNTSVPTCIRAPEQCDPVNYSLPDNTVIINVTNLNHAKSYVWYRCADGYYPQFRTYQKFCDAISLTWEPFTGVPTCVPIMCTPPSDTNGFYTIDNPVQCYRNNKVLFQCEIVLGCNKGYQPNSETTRTCIAEDTWTNKHLACVIVQCSKPDLISNGHYIHQGQELDISSVGMFDYGSYLDIYCNSGYTLTGSNRITCLETGFWNYNYQNCNIVQCSRPEITVHSLYYTFQDGGHFLSGYVDFNTVIFPNCIKGYTFENGSYNRTCLANGTWSGKDISCTVTSCPIPISDAYTSTVFGDKGKSKTDNSSSIHTVPYKTQINVSCHDNFILIGDGELHCTENGTWDLSFPECRKVSVTEMTTSNKTLVVGGVVGAIIVILIAGAIIIVMMYRKRCLRLSDKEHRLIARKSSIPSPERMTQQRQINIELSNIETSPANRIHTDDEQIVEYSHVPTECLNLALDVDDENNLYYSYDLMKIPPNVIQVKTLSEFVKDDNTTKTLEAQFKVIKTFASADAKHRYDLKLSTEMLYDCSVAKKSTNKNKNRYKNIYPYDETRVILNKTDPNQSDYINASWINGFHGVNAYIAAQAPLLETLSDFWSMICDAGISKIVMLTNLVEAGRDKCDQYWPEEQSSEYGNVVVTIVTTNTFSDFVIRTFNVTRNGIDKRVTQYHFTAWPDKGVPKYTSSLVHFRNKVNNDTSSGKSPILVHCSAGIGRTGTFIAIDILTDQAHALRYIDVVGTVETLRRQRVKLVQTLDQYIFIHRALIDTLALSTSAIPVGNFEQAYGLLLQVDESNQKRNLDLEYEMLTLRSPVHDSYQYVTAKQVRNRKKNRHSGILPAGDLMPRTTKDDYNNAVFLPSYKNKKAFIISQTPSQAAVENFWNVIIAHNVHTIVMMNPIEETATSERYWPKRGKTLSINDIEIRTEKIEVVSGHTVLTLEIISQNKARTIRQIQCDGWSNVSNLPDSPHTIITLIDIVLSWQNQTGNQPMIVHCMNGAEKSGLFCVIYAVIERLKIEQDVAITHVIEVMKDAREEIISNVEQYQFCYETVKEYIQQYYTYSNFSSC